MNGYTTFKSHVLKREEKGVFGIPFKRLLFSGLGGGMVMTLARIPFPDWGLVIGAVSVFVILFLTTPRGGIPLWLHLMFEWRWRLQVAAITAPNSLLGSVGVAFQVSKEPSVVDADALFKPEEETAPKTVLTDWVSFASLGDADTEQGLVFYTTADLSLSQED